MEFNGKSWPFTPVFYYTEAFLLPPPSAMICSAIQAKRLEWGRCSRLLFQISADLRHYCLDELDSADPV